MGEVARIVPMALFANLLRLSEKSVVLVSRWRIGLIGNELGR